MFGEAGRNGAEFLTPGSRRAPSKVSLLMVPAAYRAFRALSIRMFPRAPVVWMELAIWGVLPSRMRLRMAP